MAYHKNKIKKGVLGELSKLQEEMAELEDALEQNNPIMALVELSDLCGAMEAFLQKYHPSIHMSHLLEMSKATKSAFNDGTRS